MKKFLFVFIILLLGKVSAQTPSAEFKTRLPEGYIAKIDEVYSTIGYWKGREDIYYNPTSSKPTPIVFNIHGGGWQMGTKESQGGFSGFFKYGFAVANIEYRLSAVAPAPAAIEDVRAAILYIVQHAKELNIDTDKIVIMGSSAGAHLALMAGLLQKNHRFDGSFKGVENFTIKAIIDKYGPTDLTIPGVERNKSAALWLGNYIGNKDLLASVSPIYYVQKTSPPVLIIHGDADNTVPYLQSVNLQKKLDEAGVKNQLITIPGGGHGLSGKNKEIGEAIEAFLKDLL